MVKTRLEEKLAHPPFMTRVNMAVHEGHGRVPKSLRDQQTRLGGHGCFIQFLQDRAIQADPPRDSCRTGIKNRSCFMLQRKKIRSALVAEDEQIFESLVGEKGRR